jgi:hypothetical protein
MAPLLDNVIVTFAAQRHGATEALNQTSELLRCSRTVLMCSIMSARAATSECKPFSDAISDPLIKAYRAGGFGLALLVFGAILMLTAFFWNGPMVIRYIVLLVGALLTFFVLAYVYFKEFPRVRRARASVAANKEMFDAIQQSAIELTSIASDVARRKANVSDSGCRGGIRKRTAARASEGWNGTGEANRKACWSTCSAQIPQCRHRKNETVAVAGSQRTKTRN